MPKEKKPSYPLFLDRNPDEGKWLEWQIQTYIVMQARKEGYFMEGDQNQAMRSFAAANRAKVCGMLAGTPDMRFYIYPNKFVAIELKQGKNKPSPDQIEWHDLALWNGFNTYVVNACTPVEGWEKVKVILTKY